MTTTQTATDWWVAHTGGQWSETYWDSYTAPHRQHIALAVSLIQPVTSLLEIGCASGPNLRLLRECFPKLELSGQEMVVEAAKMTADRLQIPVATGKLPDALDGVPDNSHEALLSCYTLAYLDPNDVTICMQAVRRIARSYVILAEPTPIGDRGEGQCRYDGLPEWRHNYDRHFLPGWAVAWRWPILPSVQNLNVVTVFRRV